MEAGTLRHRVTIERPSTASDTADATVIVWTGILTCMAAIDPLSVREQFISAQMQASATHRISVRFRGEISDLNGSERIVHGQRIFVLVGLPVNVGERNREIQFLCVEGLRDN